MEIIRICDICESKENLRVTEFHLPDSIKTTRDICTDCYINLLRGAVTTYFIRNQLEYESFNNYLLSVVDSRIKNRSKSNEKL